MFRKLFSLIFCYILFQTGTSFPKPKKEIIPAPASFHRSFLGLKNNIWADIINDTLSIDTKTFFYESIAGKVDYICSVVEIYNKNDSLIYEFIKDAEDTLAVRQVIEISPLEVDTFYVRSWGFCHHLIIDSSDNIRKRKLKVATTKLYEFWKPTKEFLARQDSIKNAN